MNLILSNLDPAMDEVWQILEMLSGHLSYCKVHDFPLIVLVSSDAMHSSVPTLHWLF
jgi:hypothetical protein